MKLHRSNEDYPKKTAQNFIGTAKLPDMDKEGSYEILIEKGIPRKADKRRMKKRTHEYYSSPDYNNGILSCPLKDEEHPMKFN